LCSKNDRFVIFELLHPYNTTQIAELIAQLSNLQHTSHQVYLINIGRALNQCEDKWNDRRYYHRIPQHL